MKKFKQICLCALVTVLLSCNSDDGGNSSTFNSDVIGIWDLIAVNISAAQDVNNDGTSSSNLIDEVACISGTLLIDSDFTWTLEQSNINVTEITGGLFFADCTGSTTTRGNWNSDATSVSFAGDSAPSPFSIVNGQLVNQVGDNLPGIQSYVYALRP